MWKSRCTGAVPACGCVSVAGSQSRMLCSSECSATSFRHIKGWVLQRQYSIGEANVCSQQLCGCVLIRIVLVRYRSIVARYVQHSAESSPRRYELRWISKELMARRIGTLCCMASGV